MYFVDLIHENSEKSEWEDTLILCLATENNPSRHIFCGFNAVMNPLLVGCERFSSSLTAGKLGKPQQFVF